MKLNKDNWTKETLGNLCFINIGKTPSRTDLRNFGQGYTWLSISDFNGKYLTKSKECITEHALTTASFKIVEKGVIILTFKLTLGKVAITGKPLYTNEAIAALPTKSNQIERNFLFYALQAIDYYSKSDKAVKGATLNKAKLNLIPIPLPPLAEQQRLATLFQSIDESIEQMEQQASDLRALKGQLLRDLLLPTPVFGNLLKEKTLSRETLGSIAVEVVKSCKDPNAAGLKYFVGLEHITSGNFNLNGKREVAKGTTFTKTFEEGDILFGKRRAYLKKVAVADFEGLCSSDILVLKAKETKILKDLLPFYMSGDAIFDMAVSTSAGSLSPRTKWKDLSKFELLLPDKNTQQIILNVLQQIEAVTQLCSIQTQTLKQLKQTLLNKILGV